MRISPALHGHAFIKGHGTENDFVLLPDHAGALDLGAAEVAEIADRRAGIGGDGVIRVVRSAESGIPGAEDQAAAGAEWFMDYRNADGSIAEMCGNGVRVFAHHLVSEGLADGGRFSIATRDGVKGVACLDNPFEPNGEPWYEVDIGTWRLPGGEPVVDVAGVDVPRPGLEVDLGNPHIVLALAANDELISADLHHQPRVDPVPESGANIELVVIEGLGSLRMRVHERGVGETRSCGTGACAAAIAAWTWAGGDAGAPRVWRVQVPGGDLRVTLADDRVLLAGPAELVAAGTLG